MVPTVWKHLLDGQETSPIRRPTLITRVSWGPPVFIACDFFVFHCYMGVLSLFSLSLFPFFLSFCFSSLLHVCGCNGNFSHGVHFSRSSLLKTQGEKHHPLCQPEPTAFTSGLCFSPSLYFFSLYNNYFRRIKNSRSNSSRLFLQLS